MPVILERKDYDRWLDHDSSQLPLDLLRAFPAERMRAWKVNKSVGKVTNDSPQLLEADESQPEPRLDFGEPQPPV